MDVAASPVRTESFTTQIDGFSTDIVVSKFSDKLFIIVTQVGKIGNLIEIRRDVAKKDASDGGRVFDIRLLLGRDDEEIHAAARYLMNFVETDQTVLLALSLKDYRPETLKRIGQSIRI